MEPAPPAQPSRRRPAPGRFARRTLVLGLLAAVLSPAASAAADGSYIVVLKGKTSAREHAARNAVRAKRVFGAALNGYTADLSRGRLKRLKADPRVAYVVPDRQVRLDGKPFSDKTPPGQDPSRDKSSGNSSHGNASPGKTTLQTLPTGIDRIDGELSSARSGDGAGSVSGVGIAVLDTGSGPHPDLNVAGGKACVGSDYNDGNGHGTHVAGTIAAKDDAAGVVGVVPGAPIYSVRVLDASGNGYTSSLLCGIDWVTANAAALGIRVASLSLSLAGTDDGDCGRTNNDPVHQAVCASVAKGVTYVAAAGNDTHDFAQEVPAAYDEVLTVTAAADANGRPGGGGVLPKQCSPNPDDTPADFSNFALPGSSDTYHTIAAPGKCINSDWRGGGYKLESGTSMATPHVSGAVALCIASGACASLTPAGVIAKLRSDAAAQPASFGFQGDPRSPIAGRYYGYLLTVAGY